MSNALVKRLCSALEEIHRNELARRVKSHGRFLSEYEVEKFAGHALRWLMEGWQ